MKASLMFVLATVATWRPFMFLNRKQRAEQPKEPSHVLYDDFLFIEPRIKKAEPLQLRLTLKITNGLTKEAILGTKFVLEEDGRHIHVGFHDLLQQFVKRELYWLTERGHPELCLGTVKRNVQNELPRFCWESVENLNDRWLFVDLSIDAKSEIYR